MEDLTQKQTVHKRSWCKAILFAGMLLFAFYASTHMVAAGDTWVAMACGRHFANHGVDTVEPFSFNSHPAGPSEEQLEKFPAWSRGMIKKWHPTGWINQNWLTHLIFYKLATWFGDGDTFNYNMLVYWKFVLFGLTTFCVYAISKQLGAGDILAALGACLAMVVGRTFYDIRPACYSNLLVPILLLLFALTVYKNYKIIWLLIPLVIFWSGVHGGYIYAYIMMVPFVGIHLLLQLKSRWSISIGLISLWLVLYLMSYKFINNAYYLEVNKQAVVPSLIKDGMLLFWLILAIGSIATTLYKKIESIPFYMYHFIAGAIYFMSLGTRFFASSPSNGEFSKQYIILYSSFVSSSILGYLFMAFVGTALIFALALKKERFVVMSTKGIGHTIAAGIVSFVTMIVLSPFHLTNLTHTFEISVSKHAASWRSVNEWRPAFDFMDKTMKSPNPVGKEGWFGVMCVLTAVALLVWFISYFLKPKTSGTSGRRNPALADDTDQIPWPKIDLAMVVLSFLTIYMAIRSRRFIALAGPAAMPVVMVLVHQCWQMITTHIQSERGLTPSPIVLGARYKNIICGALGLFVILPLAIFWTAKYKRIYLDPWPSDDRYNSVFMRMTASHLKPFEVCQFINDNKMSGRVFNYWTEGGAVAFGQTADEETGQIPLKLFMDGRAQAAYDHDTFKLWQNIHSGNDIENKKYYGHNAATARNRVNSLRKKGKTKTTEYKKALDIYNESLKETGLWIHSQLEQRDVWVALMPKAQQDSTFMRALASTKKWKTAYLDNVQHMLVNIDSEKGQALISQILNDEAVFPDTFSKNMTTVTAIFENNYAKRFNDLYKLTKAAFDEHPYPSAAIAMTRLHNLPMFRDQVSSDLQAYLDDFLAKQDEYKNQDGYFLRASSADVATRFLQNTKPKEAKKYRQIADNLRNDLESIQNMYIW